VALGFTPRMSGEMVERENGGRREVRGGREKGLKKD